MRDPVGSAAPRAWRRALLHIALALGFVIAATIIALGEGSVIEAFEIAPIPGVTEDFIRGVDISTLEKVQHYGGRFFDRGVERDVLDILKDRGVNWVRLKTWHNPVLDEGFNDQESLVRMARRVKAKGFKLLVNFHYSDHWADPAKQYKPAAWEELDFPELIEAVYTYTKEVIADLQ